MKVKDFVTMKNVKTQLMLCFMTEKNYILSVSAELAVSFLRRDWKGPDGQPLKGAQHNEMLQDLLKLVHTLMPLA